MNRMPREVISELIDDLGFGPQSDAHLDGGGGGGGGGGERSLGFDEWPEVPFDFVMPDFSGAAFGGADRKGSKKRPMTDEDRNAIGIIGHDQSEAEFFRTQSDVYQLKYDLEVKRRNMLGGIKPDNPQYKDVMLQYRTTAIQLATDLFLQSDKLPKAYILGRRWYNEEVPAEGLSFFYDERTGYELDQFANMILRSTERWEIMYGFGVWKELAILVDLSMQTGSTFAIDLTLNLMICGAHSSGKSYLFKSIGDTLPPGLFRPVTRSTNMASAVGGCHDIAVYYHDEFTADEIGGGDTREKNSAADSIRKSILTEPIVRTETIFCDPETRARVKEYHISSHRVAHVGCYDGVIPKKETPLFARFFPLTIDHIDTRSEDSIINRMNQTRDPDLPPVVRELRHVCRLVHFFVMLANYYIFVGALDEPCMDAYQHYYARFSHRMQQLGYQLSDTKAYRKMFFAARTLTIRYAVHVALFSDLSHAVRFDETNQSYHNFFENPQYYIQLMQAHLFCTRSISVFTFSLCRSLFGNPVASRVLDTARRLKISKHMDLFDISCFIRPEQLNVEPLSDDALKKIQERRSSRIRAPEDDGEDDNENYRQDGAEAEAMIYQEEHEKMLNALYLLESSSAEIAAQRATEAEEAMAKLSLAEQTPIEHHRRQRIVVPRAAPHTLMSGIASLLSKEKARAEQRAELEERIKARSEMREVRSGPKVPEEVSEEGEDGDGGGGGGGNDNGDDDDDAVSDTALRARSEMLELERLGFTSDREDSELAYAMARGETPNTVGLTTSDVSNLEVGYNDRALVAESICEHVPFEQFFNTKAELIVVPSYVELTLQESFNMYEVVQTLRAHSGSSKPSIENITAALHDMEKMEVEVPKLEINFVEHKVQVARHQRTNKPVMVKLPMVRRVKNSKRYDQLGLGSANGERIFVLTHALLQQSSLAAAIKDSIRYLGFHYSIPGRMLTSMPKFISRYGRNSENAVRQRTHRVFDVVTIYNVPNAQFTSRNIEPITDLIRESIAITLRGANTAVRNWKPALASRMPAMVVEMEPELTAALGSAEYFGVPLNYAGKTSTFSVELAVNALRTKDASGIGSNITFRYPQAPVRDVVKMNLGFMMSNSSNAGRNRRFIVSGNDFADPQRVLDEQLVHMLASVSDEMAHAVLNDRDNKQRPYRNVDELEPLARIELLKRKQPSTPRSTVVNKRPAFMIGSADSMKRFNHLMNVRKSEVKKRTGVFQASDLVTDTRRQVLASFHTNADDPFAALTSAASIDSFPSLEQAQSVMSVAAAPVLKSSAMIQRLEREVTMHQVELDAQCEVDDEALNEQEHQSLALEGPSIATEAFKNSRTEAVQRVMGIIPPSDVSGGGESLFRKVIKK